MKKFEKKFIFLAFSLLIFLPVFITAAWIETPSVPTLNLDDSYNCSRINICPCPTFSWTSTNTSPSVYYNLYRINPDGSTSTYPNVLSPFRDEGSGSLSFDGINDYISVPNSSSLQLIYDLNISFWAFPTNVAKSRQTLVAKAYGGEFDLTMEPDGSLSYYQGSGGGNNAPYMTCYTPTTTISTQVTNINDVGQGSSISIDYSGHPIISYMDNTVGKLMFTRCGVNSCSDNSNNTTTQIANTDNVGSYTSLTRSALGWPIISYMNNTDGDLMITRCGNDYCSSGNNTTQIANTDNVGSYTSIAIGTDGLPIISYMNDTDGDLMITKCGTWNCISGNTTTQITDTDMTGYETFIAIGTDGLPIISYRNATDSDLMITKCGNVSCSSGNTTIQIADTDMIGYESSIAIATSGLPIISYRNNTDGDLMITKCSNASCSATSTNITTQITDTDMTGYESSIAIPSDGLPIISYRNNTDGDLMITKCGNVSCSSGNTTTQIADTDMTGYDSSIAIGFDGLPIISYRNNTDGNLMITKCSNSSCNATPTRFFSNNTWVNAAVTRDFSGWAPAKIIGIYKNDVLQNIACSSWVNPSTSTLPLTIGYGYAGYFKGIIDEVRIGELPYELGAILHFDEGYGSTAFDQSGNGNNGTRNGPAWSTSSPAVLTVLPPEKSKNYRYYVTALDWEESSEPSNEILINKSCILPIKPDLVLTSQCNGGNHQIKLDWGDDPNTDYWTVRRWKQGDPGYETIINISSPSEYIDTDVIGGGDYQYYLVAVGGPESVYSDLFHTIVPFCYPSPSKPTITVTPGCLASSSRILINWDIDPSGNTFGYNVYRKNTTVGERDFTEITHGLSSTTVQYIDNNIVEGSDYFYKLEAVGRESGNTVFSDFQPSVQITDADDIGSDPSIAIATSGLPVIVHYNSTDGDLVVTKCSNSSCSDLGANITTPIAHMDADYPSIIIPSDGLPIISYMDWSAWQLMVTKCGNASCSSGNTNTRLPGSQVGWQSSIAISADGLPIISYWQWGGPGGGLLITKCSNASCSATSTNTTTKITYPYGIIGFSSSIAIGADGLPIISSREENDSETGGYGYLMVTKCGNALCSTSATTRIAKPNEDDAVGWYTHIAIATSGLPIISYWGAGGLMVTKCSNASCSATSTNITTQIAYADEVGSRNSIAIGADGLPIIAYSNDIDGDLMITKCSNASCSSSIDTQINDSDTVGSGGTGAFIAIGTDGLPIVAHYNFSDGDLMITKCINSSCLAANSGQVKSSACDTIISPVLSSDFVYSVGHNVAVPLSWTDAGNEDGYKVFRRDFGGAFNYNNPLVTLSADVLNYVDYTATDGQTYEYQVRATAGIKTADSNILTVTIPIANPGDFTLSGSWPTGNKIHLTWTESLCSEDGGIANYTVYRDSAADFSSPIIVCSNVTALECYDDDPTFSERYYKAEATNNGGTAISNTWKLKYNLPIWKESVSQ